jgi:transposase
MEYGAIDLHLRRSQFRIVDDARTVMKSGTCDTTRAEFTRVFGGRARMRVLLESGTESEWVAQHLETLGHEVIVADPNFLPMYGTRTRKVKTNRRDTEALAEACRTGIYRRAHRVSAERRALRQELRVRRQLVRMRSGNISLLRSILRQEGWRLPSGAAERVEPRLATLALPARLAGLLAPLRTAIAQLTALVAEANDRLQQRAASDPATPKLMTAPGVASIVALSFQAVLDTPARFDDNAARASAFVGLVPSEASSGEQQHRGRITKAGNGELRALLVQASWALWRSRTPAGAALRRWAHALAERRGRRIAIVALARRLCRILFALWRDGTEFREPRPPVVTAPVAAE